MSTKCNSIGFRPERPEDAPFLRSLDESTRTEEMGAGSTSGTAELQIVLINGQNAGRLAVSRTPTSLIIEDITLTPAWRNLGLGLAVLRRLFGEAAATGKPVQASVAKASRARNFFDRLGFVKVGETDSRLVLEWRAPTPSAKPKTLADSLRLPFRFEPSLLQADLAGILAGEYVPHFNTAYFQGDWSGVPLRSVGGSATAIYPDPTAKDKFADTPLLARCPYVQQVLGALPCPHQTVRFLRLKAGSIIKEHRDYDLGFDEGEVRLHIPVITNAEVEFVLDQKRVIMNEGECWYLNVNLPHRVANRGATDRIHLVIDCVVNDWLRELLLATNRSLTA